MEAIFKLPHIQNEPVLTYAPGTKERTELKAEIQRCRSQSIELAMHIGGEDVKTGNTVPITPPHDLKHELALCHRGGKEEVQRAVESALKTRKMWASLSWEQRIAIFLKAAELASSPYRAKLNAATMLGQSKNVFQAEIDSACELIDFFRFNAAYAEWIYRQQPDSASGIWNYMEYRPLEGFIFAVTPFNFTSIACNLPCAPALMGNVVVWKPADTQVYSARVIMDLLIEAGLPPGVINMIFVDGPVASEVILSHPDFAGLHFTGSTQTFQLLWQQISANLKTYRNYPRIVGETGGKDFVVAHPSADIEALSVALARGAFEYQGQKCSAASRAYLPKSIANDVLDLLVNHVKTMKIGGVEDFTNFINAVIDKKAFRKITSYIELGKQSPEISLVVGGEYDSTKGYFIHPTIFLTSDPKHRLMQEEIFGPVLTVYIYDDADWPNVLDLVNSTSPYGLTGSIFAQDRLAIIEALERLRYSAGNFYINDKPTGAVVNQQPFGGSRASGTNDKAGSYLNLLRWVTPRSIKETFNPPKDYRYPFMLEP